jgi:hypothetical protein
VGSTKHCNNQRNTAVLLLPRCLRCSLPEAELGLPDLVGGESYEWAAIDNLDAFFTRIYRLVLPSGTCGR